MRSTTTNGRLLPGARPRNAARCVLRHTIVVRNRHTWRTLRTQAALDSRHGLALYTMPELAARLAGGFLEPIDDEALNLALTAALGAALGDLDAIKSLPGFRRAAAATLTRAWTADLDLAAAQAAAGSAAAAARLRSVAALESAVIKHLPASRRRPRDLVAAALPNMHHAYDLFGRIEIHGHTELPPVWRPLVAAMAAATDIAWIADARHVPAWLDATAVRVETRVAETPTARAVSCASPRHEILEALRWAREHMTRGVAPREIAIAAAHPAAWDDHVLAIGEAANLPIHFAHGRGALTTPAGQLAAALAEVLLRGFSQPRIVRLVSLLRTQHRQFSGLPGDWGRALPRTAPLLDPARWQAAIAALTPDCFSDGVDHRPLLERIVETLAKGLRAAPEIGELLLQGQALDIWRKGLTEGPATALDVTLGSLRVGDGLDPEAAILWAPASAVAAINRPRTWLVGLTSRSWPRRASEDPLLPDHVVPAARLDPLPVHQADRRDFESIHRMTARELVCSRARRDSEGRRNGTSPLYPRDATETRRVQSGVPAHAVSPTDRLFARDAEFAGQPLARSARAAWVDWHTGTLTAHDGMVRSDHPLLLQALDRRQSASSLTRLLRDPLGYLWSYGFGWAQPDETEEPLTLDPLAFGNLLHEILEEAVTLLERDGASGLAGAGSDRIAEACAAAGDTVAARWEGAQPIPPAVVWRRKQREAVELAAVALAFPDEPMGAQRSWAEVPFGGDRRIEDLTEDARLTLPWDPAAPVVIPGTTIRIGGSIDRLDLSGDRGRARVTDYKSGALKKPAQQPGWDRPPQLRGGSELQRCLYAYAVKALVATRPAVEARLLYPREPREDRRLLPLDDPERTLKRLTGYLAAASASFAAGKSLPGPTAAETWYDLALALPGGAVEGYLETKTPLAEQALDPLQRLWAEP